jgi:hypothetical protein
MGEHPYQHKLARVLSQMGGIYTVDDLLTRIYDGRMQSHVVNNSWVITEIDCYPRARTLHVVAMAGDLEDRDEIERRLVAFAAEANAGLISAHGRMGWLPHARELGWRVKARSYLFQKEL